MNGPRLLFESNVSGLTYKPSEKENHVVIVSSYNKMGSRLDKIQEEFPDACIVSITDEFGYGNFEVRLI